MKIDDNPAFNNIESGVKSTIVPIPLIIELLTAGVSVLALLNYLTSSYKGYRTKKKDTIDGITGI